MKPTAEAPMAAAAAASPEKDELTSTRSSSLFSARGFQPPEDVMDELDSIAQRGQSLPGTLAGWIPQIASGAMMAPVGFGIVTALIIEEE